MLNTPQLTRRDHTRRRLLQAARRLFARAGYEATTVDDVAREAGYSKGAYYFHFASKEDVLLVLVDDWAERRWRGLEEAANGARPPQDALANLLEALLASTATGNGDARLLLEFWSQGERNPKIGRKLAQTYRSWRELLVRAFRRAQEAGVLVRDRKPEVDADAALALHDGLVVQHCLGPSAGSWRADPGGLIALLTGLRGLRSDRADEAVVGSVAG